jgi:adenine-specific DNA-methyltransferase
MPRNPRGTTGRKAAPKQVEALKHDEARRTNIPTAELEAIVSDDVREIREAKYQRNPDLDPQLVWRGKDQQDWSDLVVQAPPLYIQEKVRPKALIDDLMRQTSVSDEERARQAEGYQHDMFGDFNGLPEGADATDFYQHEGNWQNRMILGDSLQVMASLAEREGLKGKVQCIYIDPPYGIKFNSNFQWSTTSRDVKDGNAGHITREPEQVKAFRDTWRDGIHTYMTHLRDRLTISHELLSDSGSVFVQIGDENVHRVRALLDEVFLPANFLSEVIFLKTSGASSRGLPGIYDVLLWYAKDATQVKYRPILKAKVPGEPGATQYEWEAVAPGQSLRIGIAAAAELDPSRLFAHDNMTSQSGGDTINFPVILNGATYSPSPGYWKTGREGMERLSKSDRLMGLGRTLRYRRFLADFPTSPLTNLWDALRLSGFAEPKRYVVETNSRVVERCLLMASDPGDLVIDPTCGSGTTAFVAEQWGRRWITIDTSRVALALARARIMGARYPYYLLADSPEGHRKEAEVTRTAVSSKAAYGDIRQGFVYERVPHIQLRDIANNAEIDVIWERFQEILEPLRERLNAAVGESWEEWEIPREAGEGWSSEAVEAHGAWWEQRIARQREIDASIAAKAEFEYLYDKPYEDNKKVRVAGPFTVESLSPHRVLGVDENDELLDGIGEPSEPYDVRDFPTMVMENLKAAGVQQAHKEDKITFSSVTPWPGDYVCGEGRYLEGSGTEDADEGGATAGSEKRAAIFIGPEFGTVSRPDLVRAAREAAEAGFDVLIACAFNYEAHASEFARLGAVPVLKARMNADLHMGDALKKTSTANLFVIFGEPDIDILDAPDGLVQVKVNGVDVFDPSTGDVRSDDADGIACWFIDIDYNEESFFVRHAYFLGANDPYQALKTTLKAEINEEAWESLHSDTSRPFLKPASGRIAIKVINHLGDEVMKVFRVE